MYINIVVNELIKQEEGRGEYEQEDNQVSYFD